MRELLRTAAVAVPTVVGLTLSVANLAAAESLKDVSGDEVSAVIWQGSDFANRADSFWFGGVVALNHDLTRNGFLARADAEYDQYNYFQPADNLGRINGHEWQGDAMLGYQIATTSYSAGAYVGVDVRYDHLSPRDLTNSVRGEQTGAKFDADFETERELPYYVSVDGFYSTAFQTYWARLRGGLKVAQTYGNWCKEVFIGPEGYVLGNQESDAQRVGGFINFAVTNALSSLLTRDLEISLSGGYQFASSSGNSGGGSNGPVTGTTGGSGAYGLIEFKYVFQP